MSEVFERFLASPMLLVEGKPFDSLDYIYELKLDGIRCLAYLDKNTELRNKRNKSVTSIYPEVNDIHKLIKKRCILDGELIVAVNGVPNFFEIQRRSLMTDSFKIKLASISKPVSFVAYDIIFYDNKEIIDLSLIERKKILKENVSENKQLAISRFIEKEGISFFELVVKKDLEGVVAKRKQSLYFYGKRSKDWIKFKNMYDDDFIICGYVPDEEPMKIKSLVLGAFKNNKLVYFGHVALGIPKEEEKIITNFVKENPSESHFLEKDVKIKWCKLSLVCTVKYMMRTETNLLRQPIYKGLRFDKDIYECQV